MQLFLQLVTHQRSLHVIASEKSYECEHLFKPETSVLIQKREVLSLHWKSKL